MDPGTVLAITSLCFQLFQVASSGYQTIDRALKMGKNVASLQLKFQIEQIKFENWAAHVRLHDDSPKEFARRFNSPFQYKVTLDILRQICSLMTDYRDLERNYGLKPTSMASNGQPDPVLEDLMIDETSTGAALFTREAEKRWTASLKLFHSRINKIQTLKWLVRDEKNFRALLGELSELNSALKDILPPADQNSLTRALVNGQPARAEELRELVDKIKLLEAEGNISKDDVLYLESLKFKFRVTGGPTRSTSGGFFQRQTWDLSIDAGDLDPSDLALDRFQAKLTLKQRPRRTVIVETKVLTADNFSHKSIFNDRIHQLVELLSSPPSTPEYRLLNCLGCVQDQDESSRERYRLIYALPQQMSSAPDPGYFTLYSLLRGHSDNATPIDFPLGDRFRLAFLLADSLAYVHSTNWLHHNFSSHNVLCLSATSQRDISTPYLAGYGFARFDDNKQISEIDTTSASNIYYHPDYQNAASSKAKYRRSFELYSLGLVLIEIALWKRIEAFQKPGMNARAFASFVETNVCNFLGYHVGECYKQAVLRCLRPELLTTNGDEDRKLSAAFSKYVVQELESCTA